MRIVIDIDGTISELKKAGQTYGELRINPGAAERIRALKAAGHTIILQTARHMKTCGGDQGQVVAKIGGMTLEWLALQNIPYDEIYFGKPYGQVYIDDLALPFVSWDDITPEAMDTERINILIPMAGAGSRFVTAGYTVPKPLIETHGKTMIEWAVESLAFLKGNPHAHLIFVILDAHEAEYGLTAKLHDLFGASISVITIPAVTRGQAETCLMAKSLINNFNQLVIYNCDTYTTGNEALFELVEAEQPDGILATFPATDPRYSYARVDERGYVDLTTEKDPVSNHASTGLYYFRRGQDFVRAAEAMIENGDTAKGEFYVAPLYNTLLKSGKKVKIYDVKDNWVLGTPQELAYFEANYKPE